MGGFNGVERLRGIFMLNAVKCIHRHTHLYITTKNPHKLHFVLI